MTLKTSIINAYNAFKGKVPVTIGGYARSGSNIATWDNIATSAEQKFQYENNPILQAVLDIRANTESNAIYKVKDIKTGDIVPKNQYTDNQKLALKWFTHPNPHQKGKEYFKQSSLFKNIYGKNYFYALRSNSMEMNYKNIGAINNLFPYNVGSTLTGERVKATELNEIIKEYIYRENGTSIPIEPRDVLLINEPQVGDAANPFVGQSKLIALQRPLSNIMRAYESLNVIIKNRGIEVIFTPSGKDPSFGAIKMEPEDKKIVEDEFEGYGTLEGQARFMVSQIPMDVTQISPKMRDLMLFEIISSQAVVVANNFGVAPGLVKAHIGNDTYANQEGDEKRLYQDTVIPHVNEKTEAQNEWLKIEEDGFVIVATFDHIAVLQKDKLKEAQANSKKATMLTSLFMKGLIKAGQVLKGLELPEDNNIGDKYIYELEPFQIEVITGKVFKKEE